MIFTAEGRAYHSKIYKKTFIMAVLSLIVWCVLLHSNPLCAGGEPSKWCEPR